MKILVNAFSARIGGGQTYLLNLLRHMPDDPDVEILVYAPPRLRLPEAPGLRRLSTRWPTENPLLRALWEQFGLPEVLRRERVDVLFCPGGVLATKVPPGCRTVTMFRNMMPFDRQVRASLPVGLQRIRNWLLNRVMLRSMSAADLTIFISTYARGVIEKLTTVRRAITIPHGIGEQFRTHSISLKRPEWLPEGDYILYVSRFDVYKHHHEVVAGYSLLPQALRDQVRLVLAGESDSPIAARVDQMVREQGLGNRVLMAGKVPYEELPALYRNARLNLFASSCENCPNILLEKMGAGRPVLSSDVMPMPEFGGDAVGYFSPSDPGSISQAMERVLTDRAWADELASRAALRSGRYDWERSARETWEAILALARHRG